MSALLSTKFPEPTGEELVKHVSSLIRAIKERHKDVEVLVEGASGILPALFWAKAFEHGAHLSRDRQLLSQVGKYVEGALQRKYKNPRVRLVVLKANTVLLENSKAQDGFLHGILEKYGSEEGQYQTIRPRWDSFFLYLRVEFRSDDSLLMPVSFVAIEPNHKILVLSLPELILANLSSCYEVRSTETVFKESQVWVPLLLFHMLLSTWSKSPEAERFGKPWIVTEEENLPVFLLPIAKVWDWIEEQAKSVTFKGFRDANKVERVREVFQYWDQYLEKLPEPIRGYPRYEGPFEDVFPEEVHQTSRFFPDARAIRSNAHEQHLLTYV